MWMLRCTRVPPPSSLFWLAILQLLYSFRRSSLFICFFYLFPWFLANLIFFSYILWHLKDINHLPPVSTSLSRELCYGYGSGLIEISRTYFLYYYLFLMLNMELWSTKGEITWSTSHKHSSIPRLHPFVSMLWTGSLTVGHSCADMSVWSGPEGQASPSWRASVLLRLRAPAGTTVGSAQDKWVSGGEQRDKITGDLKDKGFIVKSGKHWDVCQLPLSLCSIF